MLNATPSGDRVAASGLQYLTIQKGSGWANEGGNRPLYFGVHGPMTLRLEEKTWVLADKNKVFVRSDSPAPKRGRIAITNACRLGRAVESLEVSGYMGESARTELAEELARRDAEERGWSEADLEPTQRR